MFGRTKVAMVVAEFLGAASLTAVLLAVSKSGVGFSLFIAGGVGLAFAFWSLAAGRLSGPHFNPAITLGLWTTRKIQTTVALVYLVAQFAGAYVAGLLYIYLADQKLNNLAAKSFEPRVFVAEIVGAFIVTFGVAAAVYQGYRGVKFAVTVGMALFVGMLVASLGGNGLANPAIALGIKSWDKAYVAGPLLGGLVGANLYAYLFAPALVEEPALTVSAPAKTTRTRTTTRRATTTRTRRAPVRRSTSRSRGRR